MAAHEIDAIVSAVSHLAKEHGLPNSFSAGEIAALASLSPMRAGRIMGRERTREVVLAPRLARESVKIVSYGTQKGRAYLNVE